MEVDAIKLRQLALTHPAVDREGGAVLRGKPLLNVNLPKLSRFGDVQVCARVKHAIV